MKKKQVHTGASVLKIILYLINLYLVTPIVFYDYCWKSGLAGYMIVFQDYIIEAMKFHLLKEFIDERKICRFH